MQLANPHVTGPDVLEAQKLLAKNPYGSFDAGKPDGEYGELTAGAVQRAKWELGYPANARDTTFGPQLKAFLSGKKQLPPPFKKRRAQRLKPGRLAARRSASGSSSRRCGAARTAARSRTPRTATSGFPVLGKGATVPLATGLLGLRDALLLVGGRAEPEPAGGRLRRPASRRSTGSMLGHCRKIPRSAVQPGDLVVWTPPGTGQHVCLVVAGGPDPMLVSHGDDSGPKKLRFSAEDAYQRTHGHGTAIWLSAF